MDQVKVKIKPGQTLQFPGVCLHCLAPASERMTLRKRVGRITRLIDAPLCSDCAAELRRQSADEERLDKLGWLAAAAIFIVAFVLLFLLLPAGLLFLFLAAALAILLAAGLYFYLRRAQERAARPQKQAIRAAARISHFSWRAVTLEFANERFARQFKSLNQAILMDI